MKKFNLTIICALIATSIFTSCKKEDNASTGGGTSGSLLIKTTYWNPTSGVESTFEEIGYDSKGGLSSFKIDTYVTTAELNANGTVSKFLVKAPNYPVNAIMHELTYANGKVSKIVSTYYNQDGKVGYTLTKNYEYNAAGKISKLSYVDSDRPTATYVYNYTWVGDNVSKKEYLYNGSSVFTKEYTYDDKKNPYYEGGVYMDYLYSRNYDPISKNNRLTEKSSSGTVTTNYTYNAAGYPESIKYTSQEGIKFYYK